MKIVLFLVLVALAACTPDIPTAFTFDICIHHDSIDQSAVPDTIITLCRVPETPADTIP